MGKIAYENIKVFMYIPVLILRLNAKLLVTRRNPVICAQITIIFGHVGQFFMCVIVFVLFRLFFMWVRFFI